MDVFFDVLGKVYWCCFGSEWRICRVGEREGVGSREGEEGKEVIRLSFFKICFFIVVIFYVLYVERIF